MIAFSIHNDSNLNQSWFFLVKLLFSVREKEKKSIAQYRVYMPVISLAFYLLYCKNLDFQDL